jgi:two-component system OmpR family response regulator
MLPGMSGYTVCETIRDAGLTIPILMLSARTLPEDRTRGFDVGASQYMSKPFELDELLSRIKNLLQASGGKAVAPTNKRMRESITTAEFGAVKVNFETHVASVGDQAVRMTPKELKLLKYFVENEGRVISRDELLREVWGLSGNLQTRAVDQFIARLRKIIEPDSTSPIHLLTIRDAGYRFVIAPQSSNETEPESDTQTDNENPS